MYTPYISTLIVFNGNSCGSGIFARKMLATERVLGPRWSLKELRTFFILLKAYGKQWDRIEERLPSRSNAMIRALFDMHRGYLSLPEASAEGFCTIMTDHYKSLDELHPVANTEEDVAAHSHEVAVKADAPATTQLIQELSPTTMENAVSADTQPLEPPEPPPTVRPSPSAVAVFTLTPPTKSKEEVSSDTRMKKKRKLDKLLAREEAVDVDEPMDTSVDDEHDGHRVKRRLRTRKPPAPRSQLQRASTQDSDTTAAPSTRLPWFYWFCSVVDAEFFSHNEFIECLQRMQLANLVKAARPIWASVRASMGHPRRLSRQFLTEEKRKLHEYRRVKLSDDAHVSAQWPYKASVPIAAGVRVLAYLSQAEGFATGTIEHFSLREDVCKVRLDNRTSGRVCSLQSVMLVTKTDNASAGLDDDRASQSTRTGASRDALAEQLYQDKMAAVALVKDLLKRKELIVNAMTKMNTQARILRHEFTANTYVADATMTDEALFQRQYAWLVVNLDVTNRYLRAALLRLQDVSQLGKAEAATAASGSVMAAANHNQPHPATVDDSSATLTLEHMRWAVSFLTLARNKSSEVVDTMAATKVEVENGEASAISPHVKELIADCLSLASVIRRGSSVSIPSLITQKLMDRMFELLEPRYEANMDLYVELRSAAESFTIIQQQQQQSQQR